MMHLYRALYFDSTAFLNIFLFYFEVEIVSIVLHV